MLRGGSSTASFSIVLTVSILLLGCPHLASAEDRAAAKMHYAQATQHYDLGEFKEALIEFKEAYRNYEEPTFLFNIAQCLRQVGSKTDAVLFYRTYLRKVAHPPNRSDVEALIARLESEVAADRATKAVQPEGTLSPAQPDAMQTVNNAVRAQESPRPETSPTAVLVSPTTVPAPPASMRSTPVGRTQERAGIAVAAIGGALVVTGIALGAVAKNDANDLTSLDRSGGVYDAGKYSSGQTLNGAGIALMSVGAAAAFVGSVLAIVGARKASRSRDTAAATSSSTALDLHVFSF